MGRRLILAILVAASAWGQDRAARIAQLADALSPWLVECRRDIHMHPELGNQEERTGKLIAERLRALGYTELRTNVAGHGVIAVLRGGKPGPVVAWRADMDALPIDESNFNVPYRSTVKGVKHACGHDAHTTVALGLADLLMKMKAEVPGTIVFIFQPAEEGGLRVPLWGARLMIQEGAMKNPAPQAIFAFHVSSSVPVGHLSYTENSASAASDYIDIHIQGKRAHGAYPYQGIDAVAVASQCIMSLQTIRSRRIPVSKQAIFSLGTIHGGDRRNVIADRVSLGGTVRTFDEPVRVEYEKMIRQTLEGCTSAMGATFELEYRRGYDSMNNDPALIRAALPALEKALGSGKVVAAEAGMTAEDFSYFQKLVPGAMFNLGVRNEARGIRAGLHTAEFDIDETALTVGVKAGATILMDYLERNAK
jgi:amidohydrolase